MIRLFLSTAGVAAFAGIVARSLSSHAIKPFLQERGKLDNFNLAADYLLFHALALIAAAILCHLFPDARFQRAGIAFLAGSILFQGSVLMKSCVSIAPFGFITPVGGAVLMLGWAFFTFSALSIVPVTN